MIVCWVSLLALWLLSSGIVSGSAWNSITSDGVYSRLDKRSIQFDVGPSKDAAWNQLMLNFGQSTDKVKPKAESEEVKRNSDRTKKKKKKNGLAKFDSIEQAVKEAERSESWEKLKESFLREEKKPEKKTAKSKNCDGLQEKMDSFLDKYAGDSGEYTENVFQKIFKDSVRDEEDRRRLIQFLIRNDEDFEKYISNFVRDREIERSRSKIKMPEYEIALNQANKDSGRSSSGRSKSSKSGTTKSDNIDRRLDNGKLFDEMDYHKQLKYSSENDGKRIDRQIDRDGIALFFGRPTTTEKPITTTESSESCECDSWEQYFERPTGFPCPCSSTTTTEATTTTTESSTTTTEPDTTTTQVTTTTTEPETTTTTEPETTTTTEPETTTTELITTTTEPSTTTTELTTTTTAPETTTTEVTTTTTEPETTCPCSSTTTTEASTTTTDSSTTTTEAETTTTELTTTTTEPETTTTTEFETTTTECPTTPEPTTTTCELTTTTTEPETTTTELTTTTTESTTTTTESTTTTSELTTTTTQPETTTTEMTTTTTEPTTTTTEYTTTTTESTTTTTEPTTTTTESTTTTSESTTTTTEPETTTTELTTTTTEPTTTTTECTTTTTESTTTTTEPTTTTTEPTTTTTEPTTTVTNPPTTTTTATPSCPPWPPKLSCSGCYRILNKLLNKLDIDPLIPKRNALSSRSNAGLVLPRRKLFSQVAPHEKDLNRIDPPGCFMLDRHRNTRNYQQLPKIRQKNYAKQICFPLDNYRLL